MQVALLHALNVCQRENARDGNQPLRVAPVRSREALAWATIGGARALGLDHRIGSLSPGKKADIVLLDGGDLNLFPVHDPLLAVVEQANQGNVDTVVIDGIVRKRDRKLTFAADVLRRRKQELVSSAQRLMGEIGYQPFGKAA